MTAKNNRLFVEALLYRYRAGIPWRDLPEGFGDFGSSVLAVRKLSLFLVRRINGLFLSFWMPKKLLQFITQSNELELI